MADPAITSTLTIRRAGFEDVERLTGLDQSLFPPGVCFDLPTFYFYVTDPHAVTLVAECDGEFAGFVILTVETPGQGTIMSIDVAPAMQRRGVGARLMEEAEQAAARRGLASVTLQVSVNNPDARRFYERRGYRVTGELPGYYNDVEDALEMTMPLPARRTAAMGAA